MTRQKTSLDSVARMFDIGFSELVLTAVIALIVFGPEKLPQADEIRRQLHNESIMKSLNESPQAIQRVLNETADTINDINQPPKV